MNENLDAPGPKASLTDPLGINKAAFEVWGAMFANPSGLLQKQVEFANAWVDVASRGMSPAAGRRPVIEPKAGDNRFKHAAWTENPIYDAIKQAYLLATQAVLESVDRAEGVDPDTRARVKFFAKQFCDAMSPTNFPMLNPAVLEETIKTGGANLRRGMENVAADLRDNDGRVALVDKKAFTVGVNVATSAGQVVFRNELMELIEYAPTTQSVHERPLVIVPPWINKYYILDLQPTNSFIKFSVDSGIRTFVVSWKNPAPSQANTTFEDYLELGPLTAARTAAKIAGAEDVNLIGYCIGGTVSSMMLAYLAKTGEKLINAATFFACLVDFEEAGDLRAFVSRDSVEFVEEKMRERGVLEGREMADTFNLLRSNDLIWNVAVNRYLLGKEAPAFDLLFWNGDATRLPYAMHSYYLRNMYIENKLSAPGALTVKGVPIDLRLVKNDVYTVATMEDHIAPWRAVYKMTQLFSGDVQFRVGHSGHIAGIISPPGGKKGKWWSADSNPPSADAWLGTAIEHPGSWWPDWKDWIAARSGAQCPAPVHPGSAEHPAIVAAPGTYVLET